MPDLSPYTDKVTQQIVRQATAGTDQSTIVGKVPFAGVLTAAELLPAVAMASSDSVSRTFTLYNRGQAGAGTTVLATYQTLATPTDYAFVDNVAKAMTLTATTADRVLAQDDILELVETHASTGTAHGGFRFSASINRYG